MTEARDAGRSAGGEGAGRRALHPRRRQQRAARCRSPTRRSYEATLFGLVASTDDMREGTRGVPREAQSRRSRGSSACEHDQPSVAPLPTRRLPLRRRRLALQRGDHRRAARRGARGARRGRRGRPDVAGRSTCPARSSCRRRRGAAAETGRFDAVVCLGCLIRGETPHFEYIAPRWRTASQQAAGDTGVPMAFGVLTTDTAGAGRGARRRRAARTRDGRRRRRRSRWRRCSATVCADGAVGR